MGWNDRLPTDPYLPPDNYYQDSEAAYNAWCEYVETQANTAGSIGGLSSQNLDPAILVESQAQKEQPRRQTVLSRLWEMIHGQKIPEKKQESDNPSRNEDASLPF